MANRRRKVKTTLVDEHGGVCPICGYSSFVGAFDFHHLDPTQKEFGIASKGMTRGLDKTRVEAEKCLLLCKNCHAEVEAGMHETFLSGEIGSRA